MRNINFEVSEDEYEILWRAKGPQDTWRELFMRNILSKDEELAKLYEEMQQEKKMIRASEFHE